MRLVRNPLVWVARFRHRRGYGVHSPFAFAFITDVVLQPWLYYAYPSLARLHPWWVRTLHLYPLTCRRLLFRLANYARPADVCLLTDDDVARAYVAAAVPSAPEVSRAADFTLVGHSHLHRATALAADMPPEGMLVCEGIHRDPDALRIWRTLQEMPHTGVTFDLHTYGVAFFDRRLHKQHYLVCF